MKKIKEIKLIHSRMCDVPLGYISIQDEVNAMIKDGWQPYGEYYKDPSFVNCDGEHQNKSGFEYIAVVKYAE